MACVTAPLAPQVIVAGAGSGKTTVMAARVVWLVGTGQVAPEQVLGLTFTNKAAGELAERVRRALVARRGPDPDPAPARSRTGGGDARGRPGEPQISTYHAFAGQLLKDHGLRIGLEPSARLLADATRFQLAATVLRAAPGPYPALTKCLPTLVERPARARRRAGRAPGDRGAAARARHRPAGRPRRRRDSANADLRKVPPAPRRARLRPRRSWRRGYRDAEARAAT